MDHPGPRGIVSTHLFANERLHTALLERLARAGAGGLELFCARQSFDWRQPAQVEAVASWFRQNELQLHSVHSPIYTDESWGRGGDPPVDISHPDRRRRLPAMEEVERVLALAEVMPFRFLVQHIGAGGEDLSPARSEAAFSSLERLCMLAKRAGVRVVVENTPHALGTPLRLMEFLTATHLNDVGVCFDTGHAHLPGFLLGGGGVAESWETLASRVVTTHLHDNQGQKDEHLWPGQGGIDWLGWAPQLAARAGIPWVLEIATHPSDPATFARLRQAWEQLDAWAGRR
ncbi:MAG: sugar phosphate isomerase/epimerase family protein [Terriglobales bacterium]